MTALAERTGQPIRGDRSTAWIRLSEGVLSNGVWMGIVLILLTPFIVTPQTAFPFMIGKALYSRVLIEIVFVCWVLLALFSPSYRPPRSRLLILLAVAFGIAVLSACLGVSVERSFWSTYERMHGVVDQAHWLALAVVLVSMVRTSRDWHILLFVYLIVGMTVALLAIGQYFGTEDKRATFTLGNPVILGAYLLVSIMIALGFLARSFVRAAGPDTPLSSATRSSQGHGRRHVPRWTLGSRLAASWTGRCFLGSIVLLDLWALTLTGTRGAFLGLVAGLACLGVLYLFLVRVRIVRFFTIGAAGLLASVLALWLASSFALHAIDRDGSVSNPLMERLAEDPGSVKSRLAAWKAGVRGFADRPVFGWGPENYLVVLGRHGSGFGAEMRVHDQAHNKLFEELVAKGLPGLLIHLAIWLLLFQAVVRAGKDRHPRERLPILFAGAALMGHFVQGLTAPDSIVGSMQFALLLAFAAWLETAGESRSPAAGQEDARARPAEDASFAAMPRHLTGRLGVRVLLAAGAIGLGGAGLFANQAAYSASRAFADAVASAEEGAAGRPERARVHFEQAIAGFRPLANLPRLHLFQYVADRWDVLGTEHRAEAERLLALADAEAAAAVASEPENWRIHTVLAWMYAEVADTDPEYGKEAKRHRDRAVALAPNRIEVRSLLAANP